MMSILPRTFNIYHSAAQREIEVFLVLRLRGCEAFSDEESNHLGE